MFYFRISIKNPKLNLEKPSAFQHTIKSFFQFWSRWGHGQAVFVAYQ